MPQPKVDSQSLSEWQDMRFGLFIHWGLYSLTAGYWQGRRAKSSGHIMLHERIPVAEWGALARDFNPAKFHAEEWVLAAQEAGMKYLVFTAKHHDGLAMYNSPSSAFDLVDKSPFQRDPAKELADACHRHGIRLGFYYSLGRDWEDPDVPTHWPEKGGRSNLWDYPDEDAKIFHRYFERKVKPQITELLTQYGDVGILWFDTPELIPMESSRELRALIHALQPKCIINSRIGNEMGDYQVREQNIEQTVLNEPWESCITMAQHWNYDKDEQGSYKSAELLVHQLTEIVSKGGNYLLNVGPTPEGTFPDDATLRLKLVGEWMRIHGEGIYGTCPWVCDHEILAPMTPGRQTTTPGAGGEMIDAVNDATAKDIPAEVRFTKKGSSIYVFLSHWTESKVFITSLASNVVSIRKVAMLGLDVPLKWEQTDKGLTIEMPIQIPVPSVPIRAFRVTC